MCSPRRLARCGRVTIHADIRCVTQSERAPSKRSLSSLAAAGSLSSGPSSSGVPPRRPSLHAVVGDVVASRGLLVSPPLPSHRSSISSAAGEQSPPRPCDWTCGVVALPRCLERLLSIDSAGVRSAMDRSLVKVHLANGCFNVFKCSDTTTVKVYRISVNLMI